MRECQGHDARTRRQCDHQEHCLPNRSSHHAKPTRLRSATTGRDATGGKTGGGYAAAFPSLAKLGFGRRKPLGFCSTKHSLPAAPSTRLLRCKNFLQFYYPPSAGSASPQDGAAAVENPLVESRAYRANSHRPAAFIRQRNAVLFAEFVALHINAF